MSSQTGGQGNPTSFSSLRGQVESGLVMRANESLRKIFDALKDGGNSLMPRAMLSRAIQKSRIHPCDLVLETSGASDGEFVRFEEFETAVRKPTNRLEQWAQTLPLWTLLSDSIPTKPKADIMTTVSNLTESDIHDIGDAFCEGLKKVLVEYSRTLKTALALLDEKAKQKQASNIAQKFEVFSMSCGKIEDFHKGLSERVGSPHIEFMKAMELEHCTKDGKNQEFTTGNYSITTTPSAEWKIVMTKDKSVEKHGREIPDRKDLKQLDLALRAKLEDFEIMAIILYTGPMFHVYNAILRRFPEDLFNAFKKCGNTFSTTIHVLVSAVQKIARATRLPDGLVLYRGLGGNMDLPPHFHTFDDNGCRGFAEWGFMSTTSDRAIAIQYSGVMEGRPNPMLFETQVSSVDRGACIRDFSQYKKEVEYLWVPCSFVEPSGSEYLDVTKDGVVTVVPVRVNANLKANTVEELLDAKKQMHLAAFRHLLDGIGHDLETIKEEQGAALRWDQDPSHLGSRAYLTVDRLLRGIQDQCRKVYDKHESCKDYVDSEAFRGMVIEMLEVRAMAMSKLKGWIQDKSLFIEFVDGYPLRTAHRKWIAFLERTLPAAGDPGEREAALSLCKIKGLLIRSVDEINDVGETRIVSAAADGVGPKDLRLLVRAGADVNAVNQKGLSAITMAAMAGNIEAVRELFELKADIHKTNGDGDTALMLAAQNGQRDSVEFLIANGALLDAVTKGSEEPKLLGGVTALFLAVQLGHPDCVELLCHSRADLNLRTEQGESTLGAAASYGQVDCIRILHRYGADVDDPDACEQLTPCMMAAVSGQAECLRVLVELGANIHAIDPEGMTALDWAAKRGREECVRLLEGLGARRGRPGGCCGAGGIARKLLCFGP